jgi:hypothetical protein
MINPLLHVKAGIKYLFSFMKDEWQLSDYPVRFRNFKPSADDLPQGRFKLIPWSVQIINWWQMDGGGDTKEEAYAELETKFNGLKEEGKKLPRPGTGLPIEFASTGQVSRYDGIAEDFFRRVLDQDFRDCWISDESSLWHFHTDASNEPLHRKIWEAYRVDVSDIEDGKLVTIFERIESRKAGA